MADSDPVDYDQQLHDYLLDRLAACGLPDRYYALVDALEPHGRGLSRSRVTATRSPATTCVPAGRRPA